MKKDEILPHIKWDIDFKDCVDEDIDERMKVYIATGVDESGQEYVGSAYFFADELEGIRDIERI